MVKLKNKLLVLFVLLFSAVILICLFPVISFYVKYDIEFDEEIGGYLLTDIRINSNSKIEFPDCAPGGKEIIGAKSLFSEDNLLFNHKNIKTVIMPDSYIYLEGNCTDDPINWGALTNLEEIFIGKNLTEGIYGGIFCQNKKLKNIIVSENNTKYYSLNNCIIEKDTDILILGCSSSVIPEGIKTIGQAAFVTTEIENIVIPVSVNKISSSAFFGCSKLRSVYIPKEVTIIESSAFKQCPNIVINCEVDSKPIDWDDNFCDSGVTINWGCQKSTSEFSSPK